MYNYVYLLNNTYSICNQRAFCKATAHYLHIKYNLQTIKLHLLGRLLSTIITRLRFLRINFVSVLKSFTADF